MKRILTTLCALAIVVAGSVPALAVDTDANPGQSASYYPISVEEYTYGSLDEPESRRSISCPCQMTHPAFLRRILFAAGGCITCWT